MLTPVVVDFEGFKHKSKPFVVKELAVCSDNLDAMTFKPPSDFAQLTHEEQRGFSWCTHNLHGIHWCDGMYDYSDLYPIATAIRLRHPKTLFYSKGTEKCAFLTKLVGFTVQNLEDLGCPKVDELNDLDSAQVCPIHCKCCAPESRLVSHCALRKVILFSKWLKEQFLNESLPDENTRSERELIDDFDSLCSIQARRSSSENHSNS